MKQKEIEKHKTSLRAQFNRNLVAKNSHNKSGAGAHKSSNDYNRRDSKYKNDALSYIGLHEQIALLKEQQQVTKSGSEHVRLEEEIKELEDTLKEI